MNHRPGRITRTRPNLTCVPCRKRKVRCDKQKPACAQCERLGAQCAYDYGPALSALPPLPLPASPSPSSSRALSGTVASTSCRPQLETNLELEPEPGSEIEVEPRLGAAIQHASFGLPSAPIIPQANHHSMDWMYETELETRFFPAHSFPEGPETFFIDNHIDDDPTCLQPSVPPTIASGPSLPTTLASFVQPQDGRDQDSPGNASSTGSHISSTRNHSVFWPLAGKENADESLLLEQSRKRRIQSTFNQSRWSKLCAVLQELPPRPACDGLLKSFLSSVRPLFSLVHVPSFLSKYEAFWEQDAQNKQMPEPQEAMHQASFFCLLWAVLYAGAAATSALKEYNEPGPQDYESPTSMASLQSHFSETLSLSRQTDLPTLQGLVSSLLVYDCNCHIDEALDTPSLISQSFVAARALGLQSEERLKARGPIEGEIARRLWYHLLWLETLSTISASCSLSPIGDTYTTRLPLDMSDADLGTLEHGAEPALSVQRHLGDSTENSVSSAMVYLIGRSAAALVFRSVIQKCWGVEPPSRQDLEELASEVACVIDRLKGLTVKLKSRGLPEEGQISGRLLVMHDHLTEAGHNDNPQDVTSFNSFVRISLKALQGLVALQYTTFFLGPEGGVDAGASDIYASICRQTKGFQGRTGVVSLDLLNDASIFLSSYLQLGRLPAFASYHWYIPRRVPPLHAIHLIIGQMKHDPDTPQAQHLDYLLEEAFEMFLHPDGSAKLPFTTGPESWYPLLQRYREIKARSAKPAD